MVQKINICNSNHKQKDILINRQIILAKQRREKTKTQEKNGQNKYELFPYTEKTKGFNI